MQRKWSWLLITLIWFFFIYNMDWLQSPIRFEPITSLYLTFGFLFLLLVPIRSRSRLYLAISSLILINFALKFLLGYKFEGGILIISLFEIGAISFVAYLATRMSQFIRQSSPTPSNNQTLKITPNFEIGQSQIYTEIRRARRYQRPASLLAVSAAMDDSQNHRARVNGHDARIKADNRLAKMLVDELRDYDVITRRDSQFIILLPETDAYSASNTVRRLKTKASEDLGIYLKIGTATFPEEAVTFASLLEIAEAKINEVFSVDNDEDSKSSSQPTSIGARGLLNYD